MKSQAWRWTRRLLSLLLFGLVAWLLIHLLRELDWNEVAHGLSRYSALEIVLGLGLVAASYGVFSSYDLLSRRYTGHQVPVRKVLPLAMTCYAFNLNLSAWIGGVALRYRLYGRQGLDVATITRILTFNLLTNWLGYLLLAGSLFTLGLPALPDSVALGQTGLRLVGIAMIAAVLAYLLACRFATRREWHLRGQVIALPGLRLALAQVGLGALNWSLMAALVFLLLPEQARYPTVLAVLMISSIAGVITHVPAGLGVLEAVFLTLLAGQFGKGSLMAALIGYRALYFLIPLAVACVLYLWLERSGKRDGAGIKAPATTAGPGAPDCPDRRA